MRVAIAGASGVVGQALLKECVESNEITEIFIVARSKVKLTSNKIRFVASNFEEFPGFPAKIDIAFCSLGTTIKKAGTKEQFYKVDVLYPEAFAKKCKESGAEVFALVSSTGANKKSFFNYPRCKGIVEEKLVGLALPYCKIYRPSLLIADRKEKRLSEDLGKAIYRYFEKSSFHKKIGTKVDSLAKFMLETSLRDRQSAVQIYESNCIEISNV